MSFRPGTTIPEQTQRPTVACAYETCNVPAICRVYAPTGWLNLCPGHYAEEPRHSRPQKNNPICREIREAYQSKLSAKEAA